MNNDSNDSNDSNDILTPPLQLRQKILTSGLLNQESCIRFVYAELITNGLELVSGIQWEMLNEIAQLCLVTALLDFKAYEALVTLKPDPVTVFIFYNLKLTEHDDAAVVNLMQHFNIKPTQLVYVIGTIVKAKMAQTLNVLQTFFDHEDGLTWDEVYAKYNITDPLKDAIARPNTTLLDLFLDRKVVDPYGDYIALCDRHHVNVESFEKLVTSIEWTQLDLETAIGWCRDHNPAYEQVLLTYAQTHEVPDAPPVLGTGFTAFISQHIKKSA